MHQLDLIYKETMQLPDFPYMSRGTLYKQIRKLGFVYRKRNAKMQVYQRLDVVAQRHRMLRDLQKYRALQYEIFYQDESYCNANHTRQYIWQKDDDNDDVNDLLGDTKWKGGLKVPTGAGQRLIINHIGSCNVFLEGCGECFVGKKGTVDYHKEVNHVHFENWRKEKVLPALPDRAVVVIDNASYHSRLTDESKVPTTAWRKAEIQDWLRSKKKDFSEKDTIPILLFKSKEVFVEKKYVVEVLTEQYCELTGKCIVILRLPVGHSELNPIELIWAKVKNEVAKKNIRFTITSVKELVEKGLTNVTARDWQRAIKHAHKMKLPFEK